MAVTAVPEEAESGAIALTTIAELQDRLRLFVEVRDWAQFHSPKNLAAGLTVEAAELLEIFQWLTDDQSEKLDGDAMTRLRAEIGDVQIYLLNLASKFDLDPLECALDKLTANELKYPADIVRGSAKKYNQY